ncbi:MAG: protease inhibitor I42 family protein [bacterium]
MGKKIWILIVILIVVLGVGGWLIYDKQFRGNSKVEVSESQVNIVVKKGQQFTITLTSNPSTGYTWSVSDDYDKNIVQAVSNEYIAPNTQKVGAPGKELWTFKGKGIGNTKLNFTYARSWESKSNQKTLKAFNLTVK